MVPALCGFGWTGSSWAEIGHSMMKRHMKVWLSVAAVEDIADFIVQENNYLLFFVEYRENNWEGTNFIHEENERVQRTEKVH